MGQDLTHAPQQTTAARPLEPMSAEERLSSSKASQADAAAVGNHEFSVTQSGVEVVQDPELSKDDRPLWVAVEAFDLAVFEFEHVAAGGVHFLTRGRQLAKGKLQRAIMGALQGQLHPDDIAIVIVRYSSRCMLENALP